MTWLYIAAPILLAIVAGLWMLARRMRQAGQAIERADQQAGTIDAAGRANAAEAKVRDTPEDIANDPFNRDRR